MAGARPGRSVKGVRAAETVARGWAARRVVGREPGRRLRLDFGQRRSHFRPGDERPGQPRVCPQPCRWQRRLVENPGAGVGQRSGTGAKGTPTGGGGRGYVLTENGDLAGLRAQDGMMLWQRNILRDFGARNFSWLISESPLIDGG